MVPSVPAPARKISRSGRLVAKAADRWRRMTGSRITKPAACR